ncbi:hypothetical protein KAR48_19365, partial [bacterium]|nr:hypothetical protein [bacterium]
MKSIRYRISIAKLIASIIFLVISILPVLAEKTVFSKSSERIIITNGDFSSGNSGFSSDYTYKADIGGVNNELEAEGTYGVGYNAYNYHSAWLNGSDHTTGSGMMFIANGSPNTSSIVWQGEPSQDLVIGQTYDFSAWIMDVYHTGAHASLTFKADAEVIGTLTCSQYQTWTRLSGSFTAASLRPILTLTNSQAEGGGNDFAVDDLNIYYEGSTTPPTEAVLTTSGATSVTQTSASLGGIINSDGGDAISERGMVYSSTDTKPYIGDAGVTQKSNGSGTGTFSEIISSLTPGTTYYIQAYAINTQGTAYGGVENFTTSNVTVTFTDGSAFTPNITRGGGDQVLGRFELTGNVSGASITAASIKLNGTRTGLSNLKLWASSDGSFGSDTQVGSTVAADPGDGSSASFSGFSSAIVTGGTTYFLTGDVAADATGTVQGVIVENASLTLSKGTLSGSITNALISNGDASLPVELHSLSAAVIDGGVEVKWITESETDNLGFVLERAIHESPLRWDVIASYQTHPELCGKGNSSAHYEYAYSDADVEAGQSYVYRLSDVNIAGEVHVYDV